MNNPEYWKNDSSYFASPIGSERALAFQEALNQAGGNPFTFRGLPYAGEQQSVPVGLPPNQQVQQYIQPPPGGWTGGVDPNVVLAQNQMTGVTPSTNDLERMGGPEFKGKESDYYAQNFFREFPVGLDGNPVYGGPLETPPSEGKGAMFDMEGNLISPNYGGTSIPFDHPSIAGVSIPHPTEKYLDMYANAQLPDMGIGDGGTSGYSLPRGSGGPAQQQAMFGQMYHPDAQGLLSGTIDTPKAGATDVFGYSQFGNHPSIPRNAGSIGTSNSEQPQLGGLLADNPGGTTDKTGWDKDRRFAEANKKNNMYQMLFDMGSQMQQENPFYFN